MRRARIAALACAWAAFGGGVRADVATVDGTVVVDPAERASEILQDRMYQRRMPGDRSPVAVERTRRGRNTGSRGTRDQAPPVMPPPLTSGETATFEGLGWVLAGLVAAFIVPAVARALAGRRRPARKPEDAEPATPTAGFPAGSAGQTLARQLARDGRFGEAVLALWREAVVVLHAGESDAGAWPAELTGREIAAELENRGVLGGERRMLLQTLLFHMEVAAFGPGELNADDFARCDVAFDALVRASA
jgi:hypothetical protein